MGHHRFTKDDAPLLSDDFYEYVNTNQIPLLGLCYGHQLLGQAYGGHVIAHEKKEYGKTAFHAARMDYILKDLSEGRNCLDESWGSS